MECPERPPFISVYLFENGITCSPEKVRVRRTEVDKVFTKEGKSFLYHGKSLYTLDGDILLSFRRVEDTAAFVLVKRHEEFICGDYQCAFDSFMKKQKEKIKRRAPTPKECKSNPKECKSTPVIPSTYICEPKLVVRNRGCFASERTAPTRSDHKHFVSEDKFPCCDQDSDEEKGRSKRCDDNNDIVQKKSKPKLCRDKIDECDEEPQLECKLNRKSRSRPPTRHTKPRREKKGFWAHCCPCCVKKTFLCPEAESEFSPSAGACGNVKATQTTPEDFRKALRCLKVQIKAEKNRQKLYRRKEKSNMLKCCGECGGLNNTHEPDCPEKKKIEEQYRKASAKYHDKRKKMEKMINKSLMKEQKQKQC